MIEVRRARPEDRERLFEFFAAAYGPRAPYKLPPRWDWAFGAPPHPEPDRLPLVVAVDDTGRIVGQSCFVALRLRLAGETRPMMWGADGYLLAEHRGRGIGLEMQRQLHDMGRIFMSINLSDANRHIKTRLGSIELPPVPVYVRRLRFERGGVRRRLAGALAGAGLPRGAGETLVRLLGADRLGAALLNRRLAAARPVAPVRVEAAGAVAAGTAGLRLERVAAFDARFDALWERLRDRVGAGVERDAAYLDWKFRRQPGMAYECVAAVRDGALAGYVVHRAGRPPEARRGLVADLLADPDDEEAQRLLVAAAVHDLAAHAVEDIEAATSMPAYQRALAAAGFERVGQTVPMFYAGDGTRDLAARAGGWLLGRADSDWDQFPSL